MDRDPLRFRDDPSSEWELRREILKKGDNFEPDAEELSGLEARLAPLLVPPTGSQTPESNTNGPPPSAGSAATASALAGSTKALIALLASLAVGGAGLWFALNDQDPTDEDLAPAIEHQTQSPETPEITNEIPDPTQNRDDSMQSSSEETPEQVRRPLPMETCALPQDGGLRSHDLLIQAELALRDGQPQRALDLVEIHAQRGVREQIGQRESLAIEALIRLDRRGEAEIRAQEFFRRFPTSEHTPRIQRLID